MHTSQIEVLENELFQIESVLRKPHLCNFTWSKLQEQKIITERELVLARKQEYETDKIIRLCLND